MGFCLLFEFFPVYPKVKVRVQEEHDDQYDFEARSLQSLKAVQSLSLDDFSSPDDLPKSVVRVPWLDSSISASPSLSVNKGATQSSKKEVLEEKTTNIRASPVLRPRAVLSSPDNDRKIRSKSKMREELHSCLKNRHIQCKVNPKPIAGDVSLPTRKDREEAAAGSKRDLQSARQRKVTFDPSQKVRLRNGKP